MEMSKKYWKGIDELKQTPEFIKNKDQEFPNQQTVEDFGRTNSNIPSSLVTTPFFDFNNLIFFFKFFIMKLFYIALIPFF